MHSLKRCLRLVALFTGVALAGCSSKGPTEPSDPPPSSSAFVYCVEETNRYRARAGAAPVARSTDIEQHAAAAAESDHQTGQPHAYSLAFAIGIWAENESLRRPLSAVPTREAAVRDALANYWSEGEGGGHYRNLTGPYTHVGCGFFEGGGAATFVQHFRR